MNIDISQHQQPDAPGEDKKAVLNSDEQFMLIYRAEFLATHYEFLFWDPAVILIDFNLTPQPHATKYFQPSISREFLVTV